MDAERCELISDAVLAALLVLPVISIAALSLDCGPWDESGLPTCSIPQLNGPARLLQASMLILAFGGSLLWLPIVGFAYVNSSRYKLRAWKAGVLNARTIRFVAWAISSCIIGLVVLLITATMIESLFEMRSSSAPDKSTAARASLQTIRKSRAFALERSFRSPYL